MTRSSTALRESSKEGGEVRLVAATCEQLCWLEPGTWNPIPILFR